MTSKEEIESTSTDGVSVLSDRRVHLRVKGESAEVKRERKVLVKKERQEAREMKKQTKQIYKAERSNIKNKMNTISIVHVV